MRALRPHRLGAVVVAAATAACGLSAQAASSAAPLRFDRVFSERGEPRALHYRAEFQGRDGAHQMDVWRDGDHLRRSTDGAVETYALRQPKDAEFHLTVLDLKKHIATRITRTNLNRIGNFTEWFDLAHGLKYPKGDYTLQRSARPAGLAPTSVEPCTWYDLTQAQRLTHVCWSAAAHLPLLMASQDGSLLWRVTQIDRKAPPAGTFDVHDAGFIRNDANQDIDRD